MENCLFHQFHHTLLTLPSTSHKTHFRFFTKPDLGGGCGALCSGLLHHRRRPFIRASAGASPCEFSSLNSPLEPRSMVGKFLSGVLQNHPQMFHVAVGEELKLLAEDRDAAHARMVLGSATVFDYLKDGIIGSKFVTGYDVAVLAEKLKTSFEEGLKDLAELSEEHSKTVLKIL